MLRSRAARRLRRSFPPRRGRGRGQCTRLSRGLREKGPEADAGQAPKDPGPHLVWHALSRPRSTTDWAKQCVPDGSPHADSGVHGVAPPSCTRVSGRDWLGTKGKGMVAPAVTT